jgi:AICAR transformylase/IMP cyclohydrolase PurH
MHSLKSPPCATVSEKGYRLHTTRSKGFTSKDHANVAVLTNPDQYEDLARALSEGGYTMEERRVLAARAFAHTAAYDIGVILRSCTHHRRAANVNLLNALIEISPLRHGPRALSEGGYTMEERRVLAARAFAHTAAYDVAVATGQAGLAGATVNGCGLVGVLAIAQRAGQLPGRTDKGGNAVNGHPVTTAEPGGPASPAWPEPANSTARP